MFLLIDKPKGWTSHDVVAYIRKITAEKKIGHAGTLDPNATGLLIVGIGRESTKKLHQITMDTEKTYLAEIVLGKQTDTDDSQGVIIKTDKNIQKPDMDKIKKVLKTFEGEQMQTPPNYSAIKLKGKKAYEFARKGVSPVLKERKITVFSIKSVDYSFPKVKIEIRVSAGTYIRSLARDLGIRLGSYGFLNELRRTRIGEWDVQQAYKPRDLTTDNWHEKILTI